MKTSYRAVSVFSGIAVLLSALLSPIFIIVSSPMEGSTTVVGYSLKDIMGLLSNGAFGRFMSSLFEKPEYSGFRLPFLLAFTAFVLAVIFAVLITFISLLKKPCIFNIAFSVAGLVSMVLSAVGISAVSYQATAANIDFGKNELDIFSGFLNIKAINCGGAFFLMGFFLCIALFTSGFYMILNYENKGKGDCRKSG